jgi:hypothetical protein
VTGRTDTAAQKTILRLVQPGSPIQFLPKELARSRRLAMKRKICIVAGTRRGKNAVLHTCNPPAGLLRAVTFLRFFCCGRAGSATSRHSRTGSAAELQPLRLLQPPRLLRPLHPPRRCRPCRQRLPRARRSSAFTGQGAPSAPPLMTIFMSMASIWPRCSTANMPGLRWSRARSSLPGWQKCTTDPASSCPAPRRPTRRGAKPKEFESKPYRGRLIT